MKKHFIGLAIFSFIVVAAAIVYAVFNVPGVAFAPVSAVLQNDSLNKPTSCWNMKRKSNNSSFDAPTVSQAVYNVKTRKLDWKLSSLTDEPTAIHWFLADEKGIRRISAFNADTLSGNYTISSSSVAGQMLSELSSATNLYVMADTKRNYAISDSLKTPLEFDSTKAFPVTIDYGR